VDETREEETKGKKGKKINKLHSDREVREGVGDPPENLS
jgi:hypothetical protein